MFLVLSINGRHMVISLEQAKMISHKSVLMTMVMMMMMFLLCSTRIATAQSPADSKPGCRDKCGNVSVPYPFGIGDSSCAATARDYFFLNCTRSEDGRPDEEELWFYNAVVKNISLLEGTMTVKAPAAYDCYRSGSQVSYSNLSIDLGPGPFTFSDTRNMFTAIGCDTMAFAINAEAAYGASCISLCNKSVSLADASSCSGTGCCQTSIPRGLQRTLLISPNSLNKHLNVSDFNPCGFAFLADKRSFKASDWHLSDLPDSNRTSDVVIDWVIETKLCEEAQANTSSYACGNNTKCVYNENGQGYRCLCKDGFTGNPYLSPGCQDIDECEDPQRYPCRGTCKNTFGNYTCKCPLGMRGDGKTGCRGFRTTTIIAVTCGVVGGLLLIIVGIWWLTRFIKKRRRMNFFRRNGGLLLQQHLSSRQNSFPPQTKIFRSEELERATDQFNVNRILGEGGQGTVYKGMLTNGDIVAIKRSKVVDEKELAGFINEVVILSQINHRNVVKILGCCLETEVPLLVYEFVPNGTLFQYIHGQTEEFPLSWDMRLQIAAEIAGALSYLHSAAAIPIYHRDIKSTNILLDGKYRAKIADFGTSRSVAIDQTHLSTNVKGTFGYLDPAYFRSCRFTDKSDVYSFGVVLVELLTGQKPIFTQSQECYKGLAEHFVLSMEKNGLSDILDAQVKEHASEEEVIVMANLAMKCLNLNGEKRPAMKEVTMELEGIIHCSRNKMNIRRNNEEAENIMNSEVTSSVLDASASRSITCSSFQDDDPEALPLVTYKTWRTTDNNSNNNI